jgi:hypothetical protein
MCCRNSGVVTKICEINLNVPWMHCNIRVEALVSKYMSDYFRIVLNSSVKIVNFINSLKSRLFEKHREETSNIHKSLFLRTEIRCSSRGKVLIRLVDHRTSRWSHVLFGREKQLRTILTWREVYFKSYILSRYIFQIKLT